MRTTSAHFVVDSQSKNMFFAIVNLEKQKAGRHIIPYSEIL